MPRRHTGNGTRFFKLRREIQLVGGIIAIGDSPQASSGWSAVQTLFQLYRCCAVKIRVIPHANYVAMGTTQSFGTCAILHDTNNLPATLTDSQVRNAEGTRFFRTDRPFKLYRRMTRTTVAANTGWTSNGWIPTSAAVDTQRIVISSDNSTANVGTMFVTYYIAARGRITI